MAVCPYCTKPITDGAVKYRSRQYHPECFEKLKQDAKQKNDKKVAKLNDPELEALEKYLCSVFDIPSVTPLLRQQINEFHQAGHSWDQIRLTVRYWFEMEEPNDEFNVTLGILPYVFEESDSFWQRAEEANRYNRTFTPHESTVVVPFISKPRKKKSARIEDM